MEKIDKLLEDFGMRWEHFQKIKANDVTLGVYIKQRAEDGWDWHEIKREICYRSTFYIKDWDRLMKMGQFDERIADFEALNDEDVFVIEYSKSTGALYFKVNSWDVMASWLPKVPGAIEKYLPEYRLKEMFNKNWLSKENNKMNLVNKISDLLYIESGKFKALETELEEEIKRY